MRHVVIVLAAAVACGKGKGGGRAGGAGGGPPAFPVEVAVARTDTVRDEIAATGQIEALQSIELRPEVEGRIVAILFREGQEVAAGTPLFQIDSTELAAQVAQLAAQRDLAQQDLARTKELIAQKAASTSDLEHAEAS
ncbi:MAG TPA: biotin/lipoyl-binding protein, partial [Gemmatimonadales bacterium]|nr:biotin/lipoyl-binding protein [Gemmatimonadales bacterium]